MNRNVRFRLTSLLALFGGAVMLAGLHATESPDEAAKNVTDKAASPMPTWATTAVKPKALSQTVNKGLEYLISQQHENGGWGQGGGWRTGQGGGRVEGAEVQDPPDVASTCIATLALVRAGNTPKEGKYAKNVAKAVDFICSHIEKSDKKTLFVTDVRGTQVQTKIGPYVDTFLSSLVLAEMKGRMPDDKSEKRMIAALNKTIGKIEDNLKEDGTFAGNDGWASVLSQGLCSKGINRARQAGAKVSDETLARSEKQATLGLDTKTGAFGAAATLPGGAPSDAGVSIYNSTAKGNSLQEAVNTNYSRKTEAKRILGDAKANKEDKAKAQKDLEHFAQIEKANDAAVAGLVNKLDDKQFIAGFGSNGGEEFLSYMNISETLLAKGGEEWQKWDKQVTENLERIQNKDGSWAGHHCITGRTFCSAGALLVLMADRAPVPLAAKIKK
ncbi:MAG TPA: prenyltransferase/squalene oxidase repeat-containing protein [Gemmataceae bacterium]|jgi:hypothetical protein|nr:prenyltransferase/squalene oxidase repeat-containing protein [Gemmataceae bacterium]